MIADEVEGGGGGESPMPPPPPPPPQSLPKKRGRKPKIQGETATATAAAAAAAPPEVVAAAPPPPSPVKKHPKTPAKTKSKTKTKSKSKSKLSLVVTSTCNNNNSSSTATAIDAAAAAASGSFLQPPPKKSFFLAKIENTILHFPIKHKLDLTPDDTPPLLLSSAAAAAPDVPFPYDPNIYVTMHADFENNTSESSSNTFSFIKTNGGGGPPPLLPSNRSITIIPVLPTFQAQTMPERTDVCCYWCTEPFSTPPLGLPERKIGNVFFVKHCFCDFPCMAAFNFDKKDSLMWERYALICLMQKSMYNLNQLVKVCLAPPREALTKFGGKYSIEVFRNLHKDKSIKVMSHPIIHIQTYLEENQLSADTHTQLQQQTYHGSTSSGGGSGGGALKHNNPEAKQQQQQYLHKMNERYNLARTKDILTSRNTLEFCMGLKNV
jgi:hypothetical protein